MREVKREIRFNDHPTTRPLLVSKLKSNPLFEHIFCQGLASKSVGPWWQNDHPSAAFG